MTVIVQAKSMSVTQSLRDFATSQARKIAKFSGRISQITVYLEQVTQRKTNDPTVASVKYLVRMPGKDIVVKRKATDMYDAIVDATDRVTRQVRKLKERKISQKRSSERKFSIASGT